MCYSQNLVSPFFCGNLFPTLLHFLFQSMYLSSGVPPCSIPKANMSHIEITKKYTNQSQACIQESCMHYELTPPCTAKNVQTLGLRFHEPGADPGGASGTRSLFPLILDPPLWAQCTIPGLSGFCLTSPRVLSTSEDNHGQFQLILTASLPFFWLTKSHSHYKQYLLIRVGHLLGRAGWQIWSQNIFGWFFNLKVMLCYNLWF
jgi:hypothetical protein